MTVHQAAVNHLEPRPLASRLSTIRRWRHSCAGIWCEWTCLV